MVQSRAELLPCPRMILLCYSHAESSALPHCLQSYWVDWRGPVTLPVDTVG